MRGYIIFFLAFFIPFAMSGQVHFADGMKWYTEVHGSHAPWLPPSTVVVALEKTGDADCFKALQSSPDHDIDREFVAFIKVDEDKVFFKFDDNESAEWYLLYDFGLKAGEGCYIYCPGVKSGNVAISKTYIKCAAISESSEYNGWSTMALEEYHDDSCTGFVDYGTWIKGLSSLNGLLDNNRFGDVGRSSILQTVVLEDGTVVFSNPSAGVSEVSDSSTAPDIRVDGLEILVSTDSEVPGSLFSQTGLALGHYTFGKTPTSITVPGSGVYILKIGEKAHKVLVP